MAAAGMGLVDVSGGVVCDEVSYGGFYVSEVSAFDTVVIDGTVC
jgi:hypothetical protein